MATTTIDSRATDSTAVPGEHAAWVRVWHWTTAVSVLALAVTGFLILMVHPRLYWGEVGNDLTPAIIELPISNNHRPDEWEQAVTYSELANAPISANRTYAIFNQNGWARSLHFLAAWLMVASMAFYILAGLVSGHLWRDIVPHGRDLTARALWQDLKSHFRLQFGSAGTGTPYGTLQRSAYASVVLVALPLMVLTGLSMSPAVTAGYPILLDMFGGHQSARTIHFFGFSALILFLVVHVAMVVFTGFRRQLRAMIMGK